MKMILTFSSNKDMHKSTYNNTLLSLRARVFLHIVLWMIHGYQEMQVQIPCEQGELQTVIVNIIWNEPNYSKYLQRWRIM